MPGGAAEMAMMGERYGALTDRVAFSHAMRMLLVVTLFPTAITFAGFSATEDYRPVGIAFDWLGFLVLMGLAAAGGALARRMIEVRVAPVGNAATIGFDRAGKAIALGNAARGGGVEWPRIEAEDFAGRTDMRAPGWRRPHRTARCRTAPSRDRCSAR